MNLCLRWETLKEKIENWKALFQFLWIISRNQCRKITWNSSQKKTKRTQTNYRCPPIITQSSFTHNKITTNKLFSIHKFVFKFFKNFFSKFFFWVFLLFFFNILNIFCIFENSWVFSFQQKIKKWTFWVLSQKFADSSHLFSLVWTKAWAPLAFAFWCSKKGKTKLQARNFSFSNIENFFSFLRSKKFFFQIWNFRFFSKNSHGIFLKRIEENLKKRFFWSFQPNWKNQKYVKLLLRKKSRMTLAFSTFWAKGELTFVILWCFSSFF